jgi:opacity protein-like surface antigen
MTILPILPPLARAAAVAALAMLAASPLAAQYRSDEAVRSRTTGLLVGAALSGSAFRSNDMTGETERGGGAELRLGWGFTPSFALVADAGGATMDGVGQQYTLAHFDVGARYSFANPRRSVVPYVEAALTGRAMVEADVEMIDQNGDATTDDLVFSGLGYTLGGGVQYYIAPGWALGADLRWTAGEFDKVQFGDVSIEGFEVDATTTRLSLGLTWYPIRSNRDR